jgi:hypothetical protein
MGSDLLRRIRWGNVGRLVGALAVIAAVAAWPRLAPPQPALPDEVARPLDGLGVAAPTATPPGELIGPRPPRAVRRPRARRPRARGDGDRADESRPRARPRRGPARADDPPDASEGGAGAEGQTGLGGLDRNDAKGEARGGGRDPAQTEFGFERD